MSADVDGGGLAFLFYSRAKSLSVPAGSDARKTAQVKPRRADDTVRLRRMGTRSPIKPRVVGATDHNERSNSSSS